MVNFWQDLHSGEPMNSGGGGALSIQFDIDQNCP